MSKVLSCRCGSLATYLVTGSGGGLPAVRVTVCDQCFDDTYKLVMRQPTHGWKLIEQPEDLFGGLSPGRGNAP